MPDDIKKIIEETAEKTAKKINDHFDVVADRLEGHLLRVAEGVEGNAQRLDRLAGVPDKLNKIDARLDVIETTLEGTETEKPLKQRVEALESKS